MPTPKFVYFDNLRKTWRLFAADVNITNGNEVLTEIDLEQIAPMMGMPELIIPARSLDYGTYKITFHARMWDDSIADPNWTKKLPFENDAFTYIKIKPSALKAMLVKGGVAMVTRGFGQALILEPYLFSSDPDYPEMQVNTV